MATSGSFSTRALPWCACFVPPRNARSRGTVSADCSGAPRPIEPLRLPGGPEQAPSLSEPLSQRELQVLRLLDSALTGPEIARELFVSHNTLRSHTKHIFTKLGVNSRPAAVSRAKEHGLL